MFTSLYEDQSMRSEFHTPTPADSVTSHAHDSVTLPQSKQSTDNTMLACETIILDAPTLNVHSRPRATRQRINKAPQPLEVPDINHDAVERKRVLNVLAQRRYRERKRQHRKGGPVSSTATDAGQDGPPEPMSTSDQSNSNNSTPEQGRASNQGVEDVNSNTPPEMMAGVSTAVPEVQVIDFNSLFGRKSTKTPSTTSHSSSSPASTEWIPNMLPSGDSNLLNTDLAANDPVFAMVPTSPNSFQTMSMSPLSSSEEAAMMACTSIDPTELLAFSSIEPTSTSGTSLLSSSISSPRSMVSAADRIDFPDSYILPMPELILLRACTRIAERMQCLERIWSPDAKSPFTDNTLTPSASSMLPSTWQPTASQSTVPHHPIVDFIPWPNVRDRLIMVMSLPDEARPRTIGTGNAAYNLAYDLEDPTDGMRIWGDDVYDPNAWEVGEAFFKNWWFVLDRQTVAQSNYWRRLRGLKDLKMPNRVEELA